MAPLRSLPRGDLAIAGALGAYGVVEAIVRDAGVPAAMAALAIALPLAWRRRFPLPVIALVLGLTFVFGLFDSRTIPSVLPLPLTIISAYTAGRETSSGRKTLLGAATLALLIAVGTLLSPSENSTGEDLVALLVLIGGASGAGYVMRIRHEENRHLQELTAQLAAERDLRAQAAVLEERARVARELHDVVAHSVSLIAVQAGAAEQLMGRDEARARASLVAVQETAREALAELRRLLTVLRDDDAVPGLAPQPGLASIGELVEQARGGGLPVELHEDGAPRELPPGVDLSAFRIVQEALTNVRRHAGAVPTQVAVRYEPGAIVVEVVNDDAGAPPAAANGHGHGLAGMRERARIYGGTFEAGRQDGRYVIHARLPL